MRKPQAAISSSLTNGPLPEGAIQDLIAPVVMPIEDCWNLSKGVLMDKELEREGALAGSN